MECKLIKNSSRIIRISFLGIKTVLTSDAGSFFKCQTDSTKRRFSVAYSFSRNERKWSLPAGSLSNSQPVKIDDLNNLNCILKAIFVKRLAFGCKGQCIVEFGHLEEL